MAFFRDEAELYERLGRLMRLLVEAEEVGPRLAAVDTTVRWDYSDPAATITVRLTSADVRIDCGKSELEAEVRVAMDAEVGHRFWLGRANVAVALARGQIRASGPINKILGLLPLIKPAFPIYRQMLIDEGCDDMTLA